MQQIALVLVLICGVVLCPGFSSAQTESPRTCDTIKMILDELSAIKVGMTRADLERSFVPGSFTFGDGGTYIYKKCPYVAIDVQFELNPSNTVGVGVGDKIVKVSKPYLAYPGKD